MTLEIVEAVSFSKTGDEALNEDTYVAEEGVVAVFDGETNKGAPVVPTPDRRASVTGPDGSTAAVGAVLDISSRRLVRVGDVAVGVDGNFFFRRKLLDDVAAAARAALLQARLLAGCTIDELCARDPGREMVLPLLRAGAAWRNRADTAYGFPCLDGGTTPAAMIEVFEITAGAEVVVATDGYCDPRPTLQQSEEVLARSVVEDPLCLGPPPGTKAVLPGHVSFDDRTYVRVRL